MKNKTATTTTTTTAPVSAPAVMRKSMPRPSCVAVLPSISRPAAEYRCISAMLLLGHIIETALQIYLCQHYWHLTTRWAAGLAALLAATVAIVNGASIVGVRRGLDFADRWFGQCLCYVMHLSLLGLVWRFLKLTFLYDRTDLREFALLRFVQVHLQTLPSLLLQTCLIYQHGLLNTEVTGVPIALAITQLIVSGVTIALTTLVLSMPTTGVPSPSSSTSPVTASNKQAAVDAMESGIASVVGIYQIQRRDQSSSRTSGGYSSHQCVITAVRSVCLLWCRTVAVGVFMTEFHVWTLIVFGVHWCIALLWLVLQDSASELSAGQAAIPSPAVSLFRRALVAYLLVFDWPPRYQQKHSGWKLNGHEDKSSPVQSILPTAAGSWLDVVGLGGEPRSVAVALYYGISGVENAAMLSLWFHFAPPSALVPPVARLTTLATCTAALTLGVLCVVASTQGPDDESSQSQHQLESVSTDSNRFQSSVRPSTATSIVNNNGTVIRTSSISKPMSSSTPTISRSNNNNNSNNSNKMLLAPPSSCTVVQQQREVRTVVTAQVHRTRLTQSALNMAANHSHPAPMEPPPPPPPPAIAGLMPDHHHSLSWPIETAVSVCDDQSSNSRNTNTLDGQTLNGGCGGSGSGVSCSSPLFHAPPPPPGASVATPNVNMSTHPSCHRTAITAARRSPYGQEQQQPQIATTSNGNGGGAVVKRPYLIRRNSSCSSLMKPTIVVSNTTKTWAGAVGKGRHQQQRRRQRKQRKQQRHQHHDSCHCRIFDDYGMPGIVIRENRTQQRHHQRPCPTGSSRSGTLKSSVDIPAAMAAAAAVVAANTSTSTGSIGRLSHGLHFESDAHHQKQQPQFQIVCTKCMTGHDPLLTDCCVRSKTLPVRRQRAATTSAGCRKQQQCHRQTGTTARRVPLRMSAVNSECISSSSTSETETETSSGNSSSSYSSTSGHSSHNVDDSDATYTTWPPKVRTKVPSMEHLLSAATTANSNTKTTPAVGVPSPWNYVHAWLVNANQQQQQQQRRSPSGGSRTATLAVATGSRQVKRLQQQQSSSQHHYANHYISSSTSRRPKQQPLDVIVQDIYSAYSTVPPRLGQTVKELSLVRRSHRSATASAVASTSATVELPVYSTPVEISV